jgi:hypothetical protein
MFDGKLQLRTQWRPTTRSSLQCLRSDADDGSVRFGSLHTLECDFSLLNLWFASCRMRSCCLLPTHTHLLNIKLFCDLLSGDIAFSGAPYSLEVSFVRSERLRSKR